MYTTDDDEPINFVFYISMGITLIIVMFGLIACCCNDGFCYFKCPRIRGCQIVDDGKWIALISFALHFYDFTSDINLCSEIWLDNDIFAKGNEWILIAGIGSILFLVFPYVSNLYIAAHIENYVGTNESAKSWFRSYSKTFTMFVVLTGGCYPAVVLVSSNIFGMNVFSSGLTKFELKKMSKIRVFSTIFLENVPQILFQIIYTAAIGEVSNAVIFAFIASVLSVLSTVISFLIDRSALDAKNVIQYYLVTNVQNRSSESTTKQNVSASLLE